MITNRTGHYSSRQLCFACCSLYLVAFLNKNVAHGFVATNSASTSATATATATRMLEQKDIYSRHQPQQQQESNLKMVSDALGDYYGEASGSFMVKELSLIEELEQIVQLASQPIPERPDGIVVVVKYSSASRAECCATEAEYERFARNNPASIFMRCMEEYEDAHLLLEQVNVRSW